jgi:hypothetical protein
MTLCPACNREIAATDGCAIEGFDDFADQVPRIRIRYGSEFRDHTPEWSCHDCNAAPGSFHHFGCDMEICPRCGRQAISCDCLYDSEPVSRWSPPPWPWFCDDCDVDCSVLNENYMVEDELWPADAGVLCVGCLERRLGRTLTRADFNLRPKWHELPLSPRLEERLAA